MLSPIFLVYVAFAVLYLSSRILDTEFVYEPQNWHGLRKHHGPFFEGWYYKVVTADQSAVVAVVPGVSFGSKGSKNDTHAFVFVAVNGSNAHYYRYPISSFSAVNGRKVVRYKIGPNTFSEDGIHLSLHPRPGDSANLTLTGTLRFSNLVRWPVYWNSVGAMGWFGWLSFLQCYHHVISMDHDVQGSISIGDRPLSFSGGKGYTDKDWGTRFPTDWIWLQSNHFEDHPGSSLFLSIARVPFYITAMPGFVCGFWHQKLGRLYRFATYTGAKVKMLEMGVTVLNITLESRRLRLHVDVQRSTHYSVMYGPRGGKMLPFIPETIKASVRVVLSQKRDGKVLFDATGNPAGLEMVEQEAGGLQWLKRKLHV